MSIRRTQFVFDNDTSTVCMLTLPEGEEALNISITTIDGDACWACPFFDSRRCVSPGCKAGGEPARRRGEEPVDCPRDEGAVVVTKRGQA